MNDVFLVRTTSFVLGIVLTIGAPAAEAAAGKQPWQWTLEERIAARLDPTARQQRIRATRRATPAPPPPDVIHGNKNPELLLPTEVFRSLIHHVFAYDNPVVLNFERDAAEKAVAMGLPKDFLQTVERLAYPYVLDEREIVLIHETMFSDPAQFNRLIPEYLRAKREACRTRAEALDAVRQAFPDFDRFLYSAIAPNVFYTYDDPPDANKLRDEEGGCR